ncbi:predicted protein [Chaetomium globosum CBS 148.51]|uniref:Uncharacterized protein n=1 Tax=Chaetomium globosum (strain ATCC 6205 / CBS 148.51 / DSM 1962 / NBRC 6347 / NRRL 1970) TaxID=306901 RepID=Q2H0Y8_CHAGB|nr:uncharacterized protein CHGG_04558 [Chaetomium globosum CBS 148.51]EAQ87939.1 predicted protein [Chaetomium globosum CBS 148.51]
MALGEGVRDEAGGRVMPGWLHNEQRGIRAYGGGGQTRGSGSGVKTWGSKAGGSLRGEGGAIPDNPTSWEGWVERVGEGVLPALGLLRSAVPPQRREERAIRQCPRAARTTRSS